MEEMPENHAMDESPLSGLDPAELLRQGAAADTIPEDSGTGFTPPTPEELSEIFPRFEILELIGKGGMGAVYKVRQPELDRIVALKILHPEISDSESFSTRFTREAKALAKINHPGIVTIHESGHQGDLYYFLMEFVDGVNLRQLLENGRISPREAMAIVPQICDALQFAHDQGIVHRDIKPENLLLDRLGRVKVADFGIAKLIGNSEPQATKFSSANFTEHGKIIGTPKYMAPEQTSAPSEVDHRADIFALGVVFYQMLTGELPENDLQPPSKKISLDVRLDQIVLRALEQNPELRFSNATEMKTKIEDLEYPSSNDKTPSIPEKKNLSQSSILTTPLQKFLLATLAIGVTGLAWILISLSTTQQPNSRSNPENSPPKTAIKDKPTAPSVEIDPLPIPDPEIIGAPPTLRALAWQDLEKPASQKHWLPSGEIDHSDAQLPRPTGMDISKMKVADQKPRFLHLWFSHPLIDKQTITNFQFFEENGQTPLKTPSQDQATSPIPASPDSGNTGWITATRCIGTQTNFPDKAVVKLRYSLGPWKFTNEVPADFHGSMSLGNNSFTTDPGQNAEGHAFIQITSTIHPDLQDQQINFVAIGKTGETIEPHGRSVSGTKGAYTERLHFKIPLRDVETFRCRKRAIKEITQPITLRHDEATLETVLSADLPADNRLQIRKVVPANTPGSELLNYTVTDSDGNPSETTLSVSPDVIIWGDLVKHNLLRKNERGHYLDIELNDLGTNRMKLATAPSEEQLQLAILIDGHIKSAPLVMARPLGKNFRITGFKTQQELIDLVKSFPQGKRELKAMPAILWLIGIDEGNYEESYQPMSKLMKSVVSKPDWIKAMETYRSPLGNFTGIRNLKEVRDLKSLPGLPDGEYRIVVVESNFTEKEAAIETITLQKEPDGQWRISGYFIK